MVKTRKARTSAKRGLNRTVSVRLLPSSMPTLFFANCSQGMRLCARRGSKPGMSKKLPVPTDSPLTGLDSVLTTQQHRRTTLLPSKPLFASLPSLPMATRRAKILACSQFALIGGSLRARSTVGMQIALFARRSPISSLILSTPICELIEASKQRCALADTQASSIFWRMKSSCGPLIGTPTCYQGCELATGLCNWQMSSPLLGLVSMWSRLLDADKGGDFI